MVVVVRAMVVVVAAALSAAGDDLSLSARLAASRCAAGCLAAA